MTTPFFSACFALLRALKSNLIVPPMVESGYATRRQNCPIPSGSQISARSLGNRCTNVNRSMRVPTLPQPVEHGLRIVDKLVPVGL